MRSLFPLFPSTQSHKNEQQQQQDPEYHTKYRIKQFAARRCTQTILFQPCAIIVSFWTEHPIVGVVLSDAAMFVHVSGSWVAWNENWKKINENKK